MMQPYNVVLSDGKMTRQIAASAGEAIEKALWIYRGRKAMRCYQGYDAQDPHYPIGGIDYEVPEHIPVSEVEIQVKPLRKRPDKTETFPFMDSLAPARSDQP